MREKQKRFIDEYLLDLNGKQAAIRAGYSPGTAAEQASRLLSKDYIQQAIDDRIEELRTEKTAEAQEILEHLTSVMRGEQKQEVLCFTEKGKQKIVDIDVPAKERLKAAELLGKRYGLFSDNMNITGGVPVVIIDDLPPDE